jgi:cell shape-determining protein MreC
MYTDEQIENNKQLREEFGIVQNTEAEKKAKAKISERNRLISNEKELMAE